MLETHSIIHESQCIFALRLVDGLAFNPFCKEWAVRRFIIVLFPISSGKPLSLPLEGIEDYRGAPWIVGRLPVRYTIIAVETGHTVLFLCCWCVDESRLCKLPEE